MKKKKILFVAMQMSIHVARWINQLDRQKYDIHLFPVNSMPLHPDLKDVIIHDPCLDFKNESTLHKIRNPLKFIFSRFLALFLSSKYIEKYKYIFKLPIIRIFMLSKNPIFYKFGNSDSKILAAYGPHVLNKLISNLKPDLIHSLEFQTCGYNVLFAKKMYQKETFPLWCATNWGSDIYFYQNDPNHLKIIKDLLFKIDCYSCECHRDVEIVKRLGYKGTVLPVMPNTGGIDTKFARRLREKIPPSSRKLILVKGYQSFAGRALIALDVIEKCASLLNDYQIVVYSVVTSDVQERVTQMQKLNISIEVLPHTQDHSKMLELFSQARIYFGVSVSDGISTSLLESMAMGAFPIQTATACCEEWIRDGESGSIISHDNFEGMTTALKEALRNDTLVDKASQLNWETILKKADKEVCVKKANEFYHSIFNPISTKERLYEQSA